MLNRNQTYTKQDVYRELSVPVETQGGAWDTGYRHYNGSIYIFCNIGVPGRTGHDYDNHWDGDLLVRYAKTNTHVNQPLISDILSGLMPVHIFTRADNQSPFTYQGRGEIATFKDDTPVQITRRIS